MERKGCYVRKRVDRKRICTKGKIIIILIILFLAAIGVILWGQLNIRFAIGTKIDNVDCSLLTVDGANEKLNSELSSRMIMFSVLSLNEEGEYVEKKYAVSSKFLNLSLKTDINELFENQRESHENNFEVQYDVNEELLREFLLTINELQEENMTEPQNAYLKLTDGKIEIVEEVYGLKANFDEAYNIAISQISDGIKNIDLTEIFDTDPDILSTDESLVQNQKEMNTLLNTKVTFILSDGTEEILDNSVISGWIYQDSDGLFYLDESNIDAYINNLAEIAYQKNSSILFNATGIGEISLRVREALIPQLNKETEFSMLKQALSSGENCTLELVYDKAFVTNSTSYVELDISRQKVWLYIDGECILETDCVTGSVAGGYSTPTGIYYLTYKDRGATLRGYNSDGSRYASYVEYWMPFNGGIGFHDASWRSSFGGEIYKTNGSHGCVNMPKNAAEILFNYIDTSMPIFVYAS